MATTPATPPALSRALHALLYARERGAGPGDLRRVLAGVLAPPPHRVREAAAFLRGRGEDGLAGAVLYARDGGPSRYHLLAGNEWDESAVARDREGRFAERPEGKPARGTRGVWTRLAEAGGALVGGGKRVLRTIKASAYRRLDPQKRRKLKKVLAVAQAVEHKAMVAFNVARAAAHEVARERGATPEQADRAAAAMGVVDKVLAWTTTFPVTLVATGGNVAAAKVASFVPVSSMSYLAYAAVASAPSVLTRSPLRTIRAARDLIARTRERYREEAAHAPKVGESVRGVVADERGFGDEGSHYARDRREWRYERGSDWTDEDERKHPRDDEGKFAEKGAGAGGGKARSPRAKKARPTVGALRARVEELRDGPHKLADVLALIKGVASLTRGEIRELRDRLGVMGAGGVKQEEAAAIVRRALERAPGPAPADPDAAGLPPARDRLARIVAKEGSGAAPYLDMLVSQLKADHLVADDADAPAILADLRRQASGQRPYGREVSTDRLRPILKALGKDYGELTPAELFAILPHIDYPDQVTGGVQADKSAVLARRRISRDAVEASGLGGGEGAAGKPARSRAPTSYKLLEEGEAPGEQERGEKRAGRMPRPFRLQGDPKPERKPRAGGPRAEGRRPGGAGDLPPLSERLDRIVAREQGGGAPFADMLVEALRQSGAVPDGASAPALLADLKREAQGHAALNYPVSAAQVGAALKVLGPDFGVLTVGELYRVLPHLEYPEHHGSTDRTLIEKRKFPRGLAEKLR